MLREIEKLPVLGSGFTEPCIWFAPGATVTVTGLLPSGYVGPTPLIVPVNTKEAVPCWTLCEVRPLNAAFAMTF